MSSALLKAGWFVAALLVAGAIAGPPAAAQTRAEMNDKIEALEKQLRAVQRRVFDQDSPYFHEDTEETVAAPPPAGRGAADPALLADLTVRVEQVTSELARLTGMIEELRHANRQLRERLARFERDVDLRLQRLEGAGAVAPALSLPLADEGQGAGADAPGSADAGERPGDGAPTGSAAEARTASAVLPPGTPREQYDYAMSLLRRERMDRAEQAFRAFLDRHGDHTLAANARFWLGETFFRRGQFPQAAEAFLRGYQDFPDSNKAPDTVLKLGMALAALGETDEACAAFDTLEAQYPEAEQRILRQMESERRRLGCG